VPTASLARSSCSLQRGASSSGSSMSASFRCARLAAARAGWRCLGVSRAQARRPGAALRLPASPAPACDGRLSSGATRATTDTARATTDAECRAAAGTPPPPHAAPRPARPQTWPRPSRPGAAAAAEGTSP
jgi:hypothetical protein